MFVTKADNERMTRFGPGTPAGELLRRYWHPVAVITELSEEQPTKFVRLLGEDLVLFRDKSGQVGLLADHCPHRGASLLYGRVEERGIACAYHGWLYDVRGNCLETPAEPGDSLFHLTVKHRAYSVRPHFGLYWAYLGPEPAPLLPICDLMAEGTLMYIVEVPDMNVNWLQVVENNMDGTHVHILHQDTGGPREHVVNTTRGSIDRLASLDYWEGPCGILRKAVYVDGNVQEDALIFPNLRRRANEISIKVAVDDTHSKKYMLRFSPTADRPRPPLIEHYVLSTGQEKEPPDAVHPVAHYRVDRLQFQDFMVMETQGAISARDNWRMGTSDRGLALLHQVLLREMEKVERGLDPLGVVRDADAPPIDTQAARARVTYSDRAEGVRVYPREQAPVGRA